MTRYDGDWAAAVARSRGLDLNAAEAAQLAVLVAPVLERFAEITGRLRDDDDMYEFRRLLVAEARHF